LLKYSHTHTHTHKNLVRYKSENNFVGSSKLRKMLKLIVRISKPFAALMLELYNYFDGLIKLFSDLYLAKILDISTKSFFPCALEY